jgi:hypothetical protein
MSDDVRNQLSPAPSDPAGPLRHFRVGRRAVLTSLATGVGAAVFASSAPAAHVHQAATATAKPVDGPASAGSQLEFLDQHAFETLVLLSEQIIPGSRATKVAEFLDRLLAVESTDTQKGFMQALGAFERQAREAHGKPWKALTEAEATALLTKMSALPDENATRGAFDDIKHAVAETYYGTEAGMKELGWNGTIAFAAPGVCG